MLEEGESQEPYNRPVGRRLQALYMVFEKGKNQAPQEEAGIYPGRPAFSPLSFLSSIKEDNDEISLSKAR
jgi:hypothetical protein